MVMVFFFRARVSECRMSLVIFQNALGGWRITIRIARHADFSR
jgi:hypothetical protein